MLGGADRPKSQKLLSRMLLWLGRPPTDLLSLSKLLWWNIFLSYGLKLECLLTTSLRSFSTCVSKPLWETFSFARNGLIYLKALGVAGPFSSYLLIVIAEFLNELESSLNWKLPEAMLSSFCTGSCGLFASPRLILLLIWFLRNSYYIYA